MASDAASLLAGVTVSAATSVAAWWLRGRYEQRQRHIDAAIRRPPAGKQRPISEPQSNVIPISRQSDGNGLIA